MASFIGTENDDTLTGTSQNDVFDGLGGSDTFLIGRGGGFDLFSDTGLGGWDRILAAQAGTTIGLQSGFGPSSGIEEISANGLTNVSILGGDTADLFDFSATLLTGIVKVAGGPGADSFTGSAGNDDLRGNNGSDRLYGGLGNDALMGGDRNDFDPAVNALHGADGDDWLDGGEGNDELAGGANNDSLLGGAGNDILQGGSGADALTGGAGADSFRFVSVSEGGDLVLDFEQASDRIDLSRIDARSGTLLKNEAFAFGGEAATALAYSVTFHVENGTTVVTADTNGNTTADLTITLQGVYALTASDFVL